MEAERVSPQTVFARPRVPGRCVRLWLQPTSFFPILSRVGGRRISMPMPREPQVSPDRPLPVLLIRIADCLSIIQMCRLQMRRALGQPPCRRDPSHAQWRRRGQLGPATAAARGRRVDSSRGAARGRGLGRHVLPRLPSTERLPKRGTGAFERCFVLCDGGVEQPRVIIVGCWD